VQDGDPNQFLNYRSSARAVQQKSLLVSVWTTETICGWQITIDGLMIGHDGEEDTVVFFRFMYAAAQNEVYKTSALV